MGDAEKREKVIKGLECCNLNEYQCGVCPYDDGYETCARCKPALHSDAIALLKAQEPRVLIMYEVCALNRDEGENAPVWIETRIVTDRGVLTRLEACILWFVDDGWWRRFGPVRSGWEDVRAEGYGVTWRIWSQMPEEKQREGEAWDE